VVGRDETADVIFKGDDLVSRRHAKIRRDWSGTHVEDLDSRNGIKVNKKKVQRKTLRDRDELEIGGTKLLYLDPTEVREAPVVLPDEDAEPTNNPESSAVEEAPSAEASSVGEPSGIADGSEGAGDEEAAGSDEALEEPSPEGSEEAPAEEPPSEYGGWEEQPQEEEQGAMSRFASKLPPGLLEDKTKLVPLLFLRVHPDRGGGGARAAVRAVAPRPGSQARLRPRAQPRTP
jgi:hypothetical protein